MCNLNVLILSPSLNVEDNISGISSVTRMLIECNGQVHYVPFIVGKRDSQKRNLKWIISLLIIPFRFLFVLLKYRLDIIHFNVGFEPLSLYRDFFLFLIAKFFSIPILLHIHGGRFVLARAKCIFLNGIIRFMVRYSSKVIVLSSLEKYNLMNNYQLEVENKIVVLPNAAHLTSELDFVNKNYTDMMSILFLGRLDLNKGLKEILQVLGKLQDDHIDFKFVVCGDGPKRDWFLRECTSLIGDKLTYEGVVSGIHKSEILFRSHIFLLPSYFEGLPMSLLETMYAYIVPIVSPVGAIPEVVSSGLNGFLVSDVSEIVSVIMDLNENRDLLKWISYKSASCICDKFSVKTYINKLNSLYHV